MDPNPAVDANDLGENEVLAPSGPVEHIGIGDGRDQILRDSEWLCGIRVDDIDGPKLSARVASYADGTTPTIQEINSISTEIITTYDQRAANYTHQGWSIGAITTISPWTSSRIDATNRHIAKGSWFSRRTVVTRLRVRVLPRELSPVPEFVTAIENALGLPTRFERFQAVYDALDRWLVEISQVLKLNFVTNSTPGQGGRSATRNRSWTLLNTDRY